MFITTYKFSYRTDLSSFTLDVKIIVLSTAVVTEWQINVDINLFQVPSFHLEINRFQYTMTNFRCPMLLISITRRFYL